MGSDKPRHRGTRNNGISIHAPRMGSDGHGVAGHAQRLISIHAPRMGSDRLLHNNAAAIGIFQSTLPGWGATRECVP